MTGFHIQALRSDAKVQIEFPDSQDWRLQDKSQAHPIILSCQKVSATVVVKYQDSQIDHTHDRVSVKFLGDVQIKSWAPNHALGESWSCRSRRHKVANLVKTFKISQYKGEEGEALPPPTEHRFPFTFYASDLSPNHKQLDQSLDVDDDSPWDEPAPRYTAYKCIPSSTNLRIPYPRTRGSTQTHDLLEIVCRYQVQASLIRVVDGKQKVISHTSSEITTLDNSLGIQPPTCTTDFRTEYCLSREAERSVYKTWSLGRNLFRRKQSPFSLQIHSLEPPPIVFRKSRPYATTAVSVKLAMPVRGVTLFDETLSPPSGDLHIKWQLQKTIFASIDALEKMPTLEDVTKPNCKHNMVRKVTLGNVHASTCRLNSSQWQHDLYDPATPDAERPSPCGEVDVATETHENIAMNATIVDCPPHIRAESDAEYQDFSDLWSHKPNYDLSRASTFQVSSEATVDDLTASAEPEEPGPPTTTPPANPPPPEHSRNSSVASSFEVFSPPPIDDVPPLTTPKEPGLSTTIPLPITVSTKYMPIPTSFTPFMAVRYSLIIDLKAKLYATDNGFGAFEAEGGGRSLKSSRWFSRNADQRSDEFQARLQVPVQIVYDATSVQFDCEEGDELEPS